MFRSLCSCGPTKSSSDRPHRPLLVAASTPDRFGPGAVIWEGCHPAASSAFRLARVARPFVVRAGMLSNHAASVCSTHPMGWWRARASIRSVPVRCWPGIGLGQALSDCVHDGSCRRRQHRDGREAADRQIERFETEGPACGTLRSSFQCCLPGQPSRALRHDLEQRKSQSLLRRRASNSADCALRRLHARVERERQCARGIGGRAHRGRVDSRDSGGRTLRARGEHFRGSLTIDGSKHHYPTVRSRFYNHGVVVCRRHAVLDADAAGEGGRRCRKRCDQQGESRVHLEAPFAAEPLLSTPPAFPGPGADGT